MEQHEINEKQDEGRKRILCIDDDAINRMVMGHMLPSVNYIVDFAESGIEGLKLFKQHVYDLILLDVFMPEMDGFKTAANMREISAGSPPIVLVSAGIFDNLDELMNTNGIQAFLPKPVSKSTLQQILDQLI